MLDTATGARRQPLLFEITTAGYDRHSICFEHHDYSIKVLEGVLQYDSWFAYIAAADEDDDWTDANVWRKANPHFGISVKEDDLARKAEKAIALPGAQNAFRRCTSINGPSRPSAGSTWPHGMPAMFRSTSDATQQHPPAALRRPGGG